MPKRIEPVDLLVGQRVRAYRLARHMSQATLAKKVGVTFQQIQKYESGTNRIASSRLKEMSGVLGVGIAALFGEEEGKNSARHPMAKMLSQPYAARLLKAFGAIPEAKSRLALVKFAERLRQSSD
jgi:transcriptional regulator with XRE-family HTH domain